MKWKCTPNSRNQSHRCSDAEALLISALTGNTQKLLQTQKNTHTAQLSEEKWVIIYTVRITYPPVCAHCDIKPNPLHREAAFIFIFLHSFPVTVIQDIKEASRRPGWSSPACHPPAPRSHSNLWIHTGGGFKGSGTHRPGLFLWKRRIKMERQEEENIRNIWSSSVTRHVAKTQLSETRK